MINKRPLTIQIPGYDGCGKIKVGIHYILSFLKKNTKNEKFKPAGT